MDIFSIAIGAVGVGVAYFLFLAATKGMPAALAWVKAKWNAGTNEIAQIEADLSGLAGRVSSLEQGGVAGVSQLTSVVEAVKADVEKLKAVIPLPAAPAPAAG